MRRWSYSAAEGGVDAAIVADEGRPVTGPTASAITVRPGVAGVPRGVVERIDDRAFTEHETPASAPFEIGDDGTVHRATLLIRSGVIESSPAGESASTGRPSRWRTVTSAAAARRRRPRRRTSPTAPVGR